MIDLSWLGKKPAHECSGVCDHRSGIAKDEGSPRVASPAEGAEPQGPPGVAPTPPPPPIMPDDLCEDCACPLKDHMGSKGNCVYCACKVFVPVGPKS